MNLDVQLSNKCKAKPNTPKQQKKNLLTKKTFFFLRRKEEKEKKKKEKVSIKRGRDDRLLDICG